MISHDIWSCIQYSKQWFYPNSVGFSVSSISWNELHTVPSVPLRQASSAQAVAQPHVFEIRTMQQKNAKPCVFDPPRWQEAMTRWRKNQHGKGTSCLNCFFQQGWCFAIETVGLSITTSVTSVCQRVRCIGPHSSHDSPVVVSICGSTWDYHPISWFQYSLLVLSSLFHWIPSWRTSFSSIPNYDPWLNCDTFTASALFQGCKCVAATWPRGK